MLDRSQYMKASAFAHMTAWGKAGEVVGPAFGGAVGTAGLAGIVDGICTLGYYIFVPADRSESTAALKAECEKDSYYCSFDEGNWIMKATCKCYTPGREDCTFANGENYCIENDVRTKSNFDKLYDAETTQFKADTRTFATNFAKWGMSISAAVGFIVGGIVGGVNYRRYKRAEEQKAAEQKAAEHVVEVKAGDRAAPDKKQGETSPRSAKSPRAANSMYQDAVQSPATPSAELRESLLPGNKTNRKK